MAFENYKTTDPYILYSMVNMKLRDENITLDELCKAYEIDKAMLVERLAKINFAYDETTNQFK